MRSLKRLKIGGIILSILGLINSACGQKNFDKKLDLLLSYSVPIITAEDLSLKENKEDVYFLDIRSEKEFAISHLPNAKLMAYDNFDAAQLSGIPKNAEIIVYCSVGYRSEKAGEKLMDAGYTNVRNIYGGIFEWKNQGNMVVGKEDQPTDSVHTYNKNWSQWLKNGIKVYE